MTEYEYQAVQDSFRHKLNNNPYARFSYKTEEAYEEGLKAAMSILSAFHRRGKDNAWIRAEYRVPTDDKPVLACKVNGNPFVARYDPVRGKWNVSHTVTITHWMPLPDVPGRNIDGRT